MVEINIKEIENIIPKLDEKIKKYNENSVELINTIKLTGDYWKGNDYNYYFKKISEQNLNISKEIELSIKKINIYKFIYNEYKNYGKKIQIDVDSQEKMINKINKCLDLEQKIEDKLNNLIINAIDKQLKIELNKILTNLNDIKEVYKDIYVDVKNLYEKVKNNEIKTATELKKIDLECLNL